MSALPEHMRDAMLRWIEHGISPGSFLRAVLVNDLVSSIHYADNINISRIPDYGRYLYNHAPSRCWGSPAKVAAWEEHRGLQGLQTQADSAPAGWRAPATSPATTAGPSVEALRHQPQRRSGGQLRDRRGFAGRGG